MYIIFVNFIDIENSKYLNTKSSFKQFKGVLKPNEFRGVELICENIKSTSFDLNYQN